VTQNGARGFGKEAFDEVEPGAVLGSKSEFEAMRGLPSLGFLGDVRGMIVEDQLDRYVGRIGGVERNSMNSRWWRSQIRAWTLPVRRSMPASRLIVPWRLYSRRRSRRSLSRRFRSSTPSSRWSARLTARHPKRAWPHRAAGERAHRVDEAGAGETLAPHEVAKVMDYMLKRIDVFPLPRGWSHLPEQQCGRA
jgi:hypothetical protein